MLMVKMLVMQEGRCYLLDRHVAAAESAKEEATLQLRNFYKVWQKVVYGFCTFIAHLVCICVYLFELFHCTAFACYLIAYRLFAYCLWVSFHFVRNTYVVKCPVLYVISCLLVTMVTFVLV